MTKIWAEVFWKGPAGRRLVAPAHQPAPLSGGAIDAAAGGCVGRYSAGNGPAGRTGD